MTHDEAAARITAYMSEQRIPFDTATGLLNIIYLEGVSPDFTPNDNQPDGWNDLSLLLQHDADGVPHLAFVAPATTEPGIFSTLSAAARRLGGVARIKLGQQRAWRFGYHRAARNHNSHPALVQCAPVLVHRDANRDYKRTGDIVAQGFGINQHSTNPHYTNGPVGGHSAGCLVRKLWADHLRFLELLKTDPRQVADPKFVWATTVLDGKQLLS